MRLKNLAILAAATMQHGLASAASTSFSAISQGQAADGLKEPATSGILDLSQVEQRLQSSFKAELALQISSTCATTAATARYRRAAQRGAELVKIAVEKLGDERIGRLLAEVQLDPRNIYTPGCPHFSEVEQRIQIYEHAMDKLAQALGFPQLPDTAVPSPGQQVARDSPARVGNRENSKTLLPSAKQVWRYSERGGDLTAYPGPNAWFQSVGFTCQPKRFALTYQETPYLYSKDKTEFSIRVGSVTWTGPAESKGHTISADIPLNHPVIAALAKPQSDKIAVRFGSSPYEIPHDTVVERVASECRVKANMRERR